MTVQGQALFARTIAETMAGLSGPLHVDRARLAALPSSEEYARRLGDSPYSAFFALRNLRAIFEIPFMKRNNTAANRRFVEAETALLDTLPPGDRAAIERWKDPALHGATDRPLEFLIGLDRMAAGDHASAARLFRVARASVPRLSLWRQEIDWYLLTANRHVHDQPTAEDLELLQETIQLGRLLISHGGEKNSRVQRYLGLALVLAGEAGQAIPLLESALRDSKPATDSWEVIEALVAAYLQTNRRDAARGLLEKATQGGSNQDRAAQMLRQIGR